MVTSLSIHLPSISPSNVSEPLSLLAADPHTLIPAVPTPVVSVSIPTGPLYEGTSQTLNCTATLAASVDTDITVSVNWTGPQLSSSDRITITHPFISTLTLSPLTRDDAGQYSCQVTATSSSPYITNSTPGESAPRSLTVTGVYVCAISQVNIVACGFLPSQTFLLQMSSFHSLGTLLLDRTTPSTAQPLWCLVWWWNLWWKSNPQPQL